MLFFTFHFSRYTTVPSAHCPLPTANCLLPTGFFLPFEGITSAVRPLPFAGLTLCTLRHALCQAAIDR